MVWSPGKANDAALAHGLRLFDDHPSEAVVGADGSVWVISEPALGGAGTLSRITEDGWQPFNDPQSIDADWITSDATGELILVGDTEGIKRATATGLEPYNDATGLDDSAPVGTSSDGTLWWAAPTVDGCPVGLGRLDAEAWSTFDIPEGVITGGCGVAVAPDGSVWVGHGAYDMPTAGVHRFDGSTWTQYLPDLTVYGLGVAADGSVWLQAHPYPFAERAPVIEDDGGGLYVITPEVVAAKE